MSVDLRLVLLLAVVFLGVIMRLAPMSAMKIVAVMLVIVLIMTLAYLFIPIKDAIFGAPYDALNPPSETGDGALFVGLEVPCNRFYAREIGLLIDPPLAIDGIDKAGSAVSGFVDVVVEMNGLQLNDTVDLLQTGWVYDGGVRMKVITRLAPTWGVFCPEQTIQLKIRDINIDSDEYSIAVYVSRDRRP